MKAGLTAPVAGGAAFEEYVSDPAKPVPFRKRPIQPVGYDNGMTWPEWLVDDQREASGRPDVLAFMSDVLTEAGEDQRTADCQFHRVDERDRRGLGREAHRCVSRRSRRTTGNGRI